MHAYINTDMHTNMHTYMHARIHTYMHAYIHTHARCMCAMLKHHHTNQHDIAWATFHIDVMILYSKNGYQLHGILAGCLTLLFRCVLELSFSAPYCKLSCVKLWCTICQQTFELSS